ncbi:hypothetical protein QYF36_008615 [Acer negundo]|nr:hypothetical protein QYF36_008615 [Acer negundo]
MTALHISEQNHHCWISSLLHVAPPAPRHRRHSTFRPHRSTSVSARRRSTSICLFLNWVVDEADDEDDDGDSG